MPEYQPGQLPEYRGNPLIEALPQIATDKSIIRRLSYFPEFDDEERLLDSHIRSHLLERIKRFRQPLPIYVNVFRMVERAMYEGYVNKNPFSPTTSNWLHQLNNSDSPFVPKTGRFVSTARSMSLIGISGVGKSKMVERILSSFPEVIQHGKYQNKLLNFKQIPWIKVQCPHDMTLTALCQAIIKQISIVLDESIAFEKTIAALVIQIQALVRTNFVGLIVIDDFQHVRVSKAGGELNFLSFLLNLIDEAGVPILFIANPEAVDVLLTKFRISRRAEEGGYEEMDVLSEVIWHECFIEPLWRYQWTDRKTELTPELSKYLFDLSRGIVDVAVRVYIEAQRLVIGSGNETISVAVLEQAYRQACRLTDKTLNKMSCEQSNGNELFQDLFLVDDDTQNYPTLKSPTSFSSQQILATQRSGSLQSNDGDGSPVFNVITPFRIGDFDRIQHPEFEADLFEVLKKEAVLSERISLNMIRGLAKNKDKIGALTALNYIVTDPLKLIADG